jgi:hypothetical protein
LVLETLAVPFQSLEFAVNPRGVKRLVVGTRGADFGADLFQNLPV